MKITPFIASGLISAAFLAAVGAPSLASAQYSTMYPYYYDNTNYGYISNGSMTSTVSTPYWCGSYWTSQPCTYSYSNSTYQSPVPSYYQPNQYQQPYQYNLQNNLYRNMGQYNGYTNSVCPSGYYLWGKICWVNPSNNQAFYPAY